MYLLVIPSNTLKALPSTTMNSHRPLVLADAEQEASE
jgi:hypothetical protein